MFYSLLFSACFSLPVRFSRIRISRKKKFFWKRRCFFAVENLSLKVLQSPGGWREGGGGSLDFLSVRFLSLILPPFCSLRIPTGSKVRIHPPGVRVVNGVAFLTFNTLEWVGGIVPSLFEAWSLKSVRRHDIIPFILVDCYFFMFTLILVEKQRITSEV